jgi:uncharacterized protein
LVTPTVDSQPPAGQYRANPVFWIMLLLPASSVVAGLTTLAIALRSGDPPLPAAYHWEGEHLERDFELARNAAAHGIEVSFTADLIAAECHATVRSAPDDAATLNLLLANSADAGLDRVLLLRRVAPGEYRSGCAPIPPGHWRVVLDDATGQWSIRARAVGSLDKLELRARNPAGS